MGWKEKGISLKENLMFRILDWVVFKAGCYK